jgi:hypothetical protein
VVLGRATSFQQREETPTMTNRSTKPMWQATDTKFIAAFTKYFAAKKIKVTIDGKVYPPDQVISTIQGRVTAETNVETTRGQYAQAVAAAKAEVASTKAFYAAAKQIVLVTYASQPAVLAEFGLAARKVGTPSVATKQAAIVQAKATRVARHTMGPRQRSRSREWWRLRPRTHPSATPRSRRAPRSRSGAIPPRPPCPALGAP